jgi:ubiquinone/menaquinone biosynthesis C-methylase UbiE
MITALNINDKIKINSDKEIPVLQSLSPDSERLKVIDLGSGTGLCGALIRKLIPDIDIYGVDLSQRMLEKAVERQCYDGLILGIFLYVSYSLGIFTQLFDIYTYIYE